MADAHATRERANWVKARAGHSAAAQRRGQQLAVRANRRARYEAGAGDSAAAEALVQRRFRRIAFERDEHKGRWTLIAALHEAARILVAGPAIGLGWAIYGIWYRSVPQWGPLRWKALAVAAGASTIPVAVIAAVAWLGSGAPLWGWWLLAQPVAGIAYAAWLSYAYGWDAVPARDADAPAPIRVRIGDEPTLPETEPTEPVRPVPVKTVRVTVTRNGIDEEQGEQK